MNQAIVGELYPCVDIFYSSAFSKILLIPLIVLLLLSSGVEDADAPRKGYWQQEVEYVMEIDVDAANNTFTGKQQLTYHNHSDDELDKVFYHLFFNAFQPNCMMDKRSRTIPDPDRRVGDRIYHYDETEIGYQNIHWITLNGEREIGRASCRERR